MADAKNDVAIAESLARLAEALDRTEQRSGGLTAEQFEQTMENQRRALNPSSNTHPGISAFSYPEGDRARPKPTFKAAEVYENGVPLREDQLTPQEIDSYNAVIALLPRAGDKRLAWGGKLIAERSINGHRVTVTFPCKSVEDQARANTMTIVQRNLCLAEGEAAADPNSILERLSVAEAELARLRPLMAGAGAR